MLYTFSVAGEGFVTQVRRFLYGRHLFRFNYYLCGLDTMIGEVSAWLEQHQIDYAQIHREVFFYAEEERAQLAADQQE